jgi:hypothetical protein
MRRTRKDEVKGRRAGGTEEEGDGEGEGEGENKSRESLGGRRSAYIVRGLARHLRPRGNKRERSAAPCTRVVRRCNCAPP